MKLRVQRSSNVQYTRDEPVPDYPIAPMLLLPFIENAFKHGINASQQSEIRIRAGLSNGTLKLHVENHIFPAQNVAGAESGGIGLNNRRSSKYLHRKPDHQPGVNQTKHDPELHYR
jgi:sensor histidine kinase YesM